jgi:hypothetical protein
MTDSKKILNRIKVCIHNNELELPEQIELFKFLGKDILQVKTAQKLNKAHGMHVMFHRTKGYTGEVIEFTGIELFTDCD